MIEAGAADIEVGLPGPSLEAETDENEAAATLEKIETGVSSIDVELPEPSLEAEAEEDKAEAPTEVTEVGAASIEAELPGPSLEAEAEPRSKRKHRRKRSRLVLSPSRPKLQG